MIAIIASAVAAALAVVIALRWSAVTQRKRVPEVSTHEPSYELLEGVSGRIDRLDARMVALEADHTDVRAAVAHGIEDVERVNNRISATIRRTKAQLAEQGLESPALDAEAAQLRVVDGGGGDESGLPPVQEDVAEVQSSIPGVPASVLARVRGL